MPRYIDVDKLSRDVISSWDNDKHHTIEASRVHRQEHHHLMSIIEKQPTVDAVEVGRCKDCRFYEKHEDSVQGICCVTGHYPTEKGYCGNAQRIKEE